MRCLSCLALYVSAWGVSMSGWTLKVVEERADGMHIQVEALAADIVPGVWHCRDADARVQSDSGARYLRRDDGAPRRVACDEERWARDLRRDIAVAGRRC